MELVSLLLGPGNASAAVVDAQLLRGPAFSTAQETVWERVEQPSQAILPRASGLHQVGDDVGHRLNVDGLFETLGHD